MFVFKQIYRNIVGMYVWWRGVHSIQNTESIEKNINMERIESRHRIRAKESGWRKSGNEIESIL